MARASQTETWDRASVSTPADAGRVFTEARLSPKDLSTVPADLCLQCSPISDLGVLSGRSTCTTTGKELLDYVPPAREETPHDATGGFAETRDLAPGSSPQLSLVSTPLSGVTRAGTGVMTFLPSVCFCSSSSSSSLSLPPRPGSHDSGVTGHRGGVGLGTTETGTCAKDDEPRTPGRTTRLPTLNDE